MVTFKPEVDAQNVHPAIWLAIGVASVLRKTLTGKQDVVITALNADDHSPGSFHNPKNTPDGTCRAADLRILDLTETTEWWAWYYGLRALLHPQGYDIVLHSGQDGIVAHMHIEFQPKPEAANFMAGFIK